MQRNVILKKDTDIIFMGNEEDIININLITLIWKPANEISFCQVLKV